jgi:UDP-glucose 4-epimerase
MLIAGAERIQQALGWKPALDDLEAVVAHALAWEASLKERMTQAG